MLTTLQGLSLVMGKVGNGDGSSKAKLCNPDVFDGSEPQKLQSFLASLALIFTKRPNYFTDERKVSYALSYLSGSAK
ncbi:hypothetical protein F5050DRAFT_1582183, partial [Lentinula boryana]